MFVEVDLTVNYDRDLRRCEQGWTLWTQWKWNFVVSCGCGEKTPSIDGFWQRM